MPLGTPSIKFVLQPIPSALPSASAPLTIDPFKLVTALEQFRDIGAFSTAMADDYFYHRSNNEPISSKTKTDPRVVEAHALFLRLLDKAKTQLGTTPLVVSNGVGLNSVIELLRCVEMLGGDIDLEWKAGWQNGKFAKHPLTINSYDFSQYNTMLPNGHSTALGDVVPYRTGSMGVVITGMDILMNRSYSYYKYIDCTITINQRTGEDKYANIQSEFIRCKFSNAKDMRSTAVIAGSKFHDCEFTKARLDMGSSASDPNDPLESNAPLFKGCKFSKDCYLTSGSTKTCSSEFIDCELNDFRLDNPRASLVGCKGSIVTRRIYNIKNKTSEEIPSVYVDNGDGKGLTIKAHEDAGSNKLQVFNAGKVAPLIDLSKVSGSENNGTDLFLVGEAKVVGFSKHKEIQLNGIRTTFAPSITRQLVKKLLADDPSIDRVRMASIVGDLLLGGLSIQVDRRDLMDAIGVFNEYRKAKTIPMVGQPSKREIVTDADGNIVLVDSVIDSMKLNGSVNLMKVSDKLSKKGTKKGKKITLKGLSPEIAEKLGDIDETQLERIAKFVTLMT